MAEINDLNDKEIEIEIDIKNYTCEIIQKEYQVEIT